MDKALLVVDMQKDFCPGGRLPVKDCLGIIENINKYLVKFKERNYPIFASRDWHPSETSHFKEHGGKWPEHCIQDTEGAEFHPELRLPEDVIIISKGVSKDKDSYSAFEGHSKNHKSLEALLKEMGIRELYVCGVATDYCVKSSSLDALGLGLKVYLLMDAIKGVDVNPGDSQRALDEMLKSGVVKLTLRDLNI